MTFFEKHRKALLSAIVAIVIPLLMPACEKIVEFDVEEMTPMVVVNSLPCTDSGLFVNITYSRFFLDNSTFRAVEDASVSIDVGGRLYYSTGRDGANYLLPYTATAGDTITLHVAVDGREITGGTRIPPLPPIENYSALLDTFQPITSGEIRFTINDHAGTDNYYYIYISERDSGTRWNDWFECWDTIDTTYHCYFNCTDLDLTSPEVSSMEGFMGYFNNLLFTDKRIDGESHEVLMSIMMLKDTAEHPLKREYTLVIQSLSREAYIYREAVMAAGSMASYFAEPARVYSNLSSGIGIFAAFSKREYPITFIYKEPEED